MSRAGFTLLELVVVLTVLGVSLAVVALDGAQIRPPAPADQLERVRRQALASGHDTTVTLLREGSTWIVTVLRDGRVIEDSAWSRFNLVEP